ncbi:MAG: homoserine kinase [Proteobacteria bacterium]|nr:homoserine kinase [Pseudomonadota bacterium]
MSVYTTIEEDELRSFLSNYDVGELVDYLGISDGIENTNYFVNTTTGRFVLTIFEQHSFEEMQYYLNLMHHLADHKVPSANPVADKQGLYLSHFKDKPIALVERLNGGSIVDTTVDHCAQLGSAMGKMHTAGLSFTTEQLNPRGPGWCQTTAQLVIEKLSSDEQQVLDDEVHYQKEKRHADLPRGVIHADLFRDNALWDGDNFSGIIDFYYSCDDVLLYDLAVAANDWCLNEDFSLDREKVSALLSHYHQHRPLIDNEQPYWPAMLRAGALRFWLSRLYDKHFPRAGELVHTKNPDEFKNILADRIKNTEQYLAYWPSL